MKYLLVLLVVAVGVWLWVASRRSRGAPGTAAPAPQAGAAKRAAGSKEMVACGHCGVHVPADDALLDAAGRPYCSDSHRLAGPHGG